MPGDYNSQNSQQLTKTSGKYHPSKITGNSLRKATNAQGHSQTYSKGPEAEDDDDEVYHISQEHEGVDIRGSTVLAVQDVLEELARWLERALSSGGRGVKRGE